MSLDLWVFSGVAAGGKKAAGPQHDVKDHQLEDKSQHHQPGASAAENAEVCTNLFRRPVWSQVILFSTGKIMG
jgi:hypothetical protein